MGDLIYNRLILELCRLRGRKPRLHCFFYGIYKAKMAWDSWGFLMGASNQQEITQGRKVLQIWYGSPESRKKHF